MNTAAKIQLGLAIGWLTLTAVALSACTGESIPQGGLGGAVGPGITDTPASSPESATIVAAWTGTAMPAQAASPTNALPPTTTATPTPLPTAAGRIAFVSDRDGNKEIYLINADGSGLTRLTNDPADDSRPAWAPDGERISFVSQRDGNDEIYIMDADGSNLSRLTHNPGRDGKPLWLPNGQWIVYESFRNCNTDLYLISADGQSERRLTTDPAADTQPSISPDGARLAFVSSRNGENADIYVLNIADALNSRTEVSLRLTNGVAAETNPAWAPQGKCLVFTCHEDEKNSAIYVLDVDDASSRRLTEDHYRDDFAVWAPEGARLAFLSDRGGNVDIYIVYADGSALIRLTAHDAFDGHQVWSPDGRYLAFASERDGNSEIYVVGMDDVDLQRLTFSSAYDGEPAWSPR